MLPRSYFILFFEGTIQLRLPRILTGMHWDPRGKLLLMVNMNEQTSKPLEYHALGGQPFRILSAGKYTIEKVKPLHGTIALFGCRWMAREGWQIGWERGKYGQCLIVIFPPQNGFLRDTFLSQGS